MAWPKSPRIEENYSRKSTFHMIDPKNSKLSWNLQETSTDIDVFSWQDQIELRILKWKYLFLWNHQIHFKVKWKIWKDHLIILIKVDRQLKYKTDHRKTWLSWGLVESGKKMSHQALKQLVMGNYVNGSILHSSSIWWLSSDSKQWSNAYSLL